MIPRIPARVEDIVRFEVGVVIPIFVNCSPNMPEDMDAPHGSQLDYRIASIDRRTGRMTLEPIVPVEQVDNSSMRLETSPDGARWTDANVPDRYSGVVNMEAITALINSPWYIMQYGGSAPPIPSHIADSTRYSIAHNLLDNGLITEQDVHLGESNQETEDNGDEDTEE